MSDMASTTISNSSFPHKNEREILAAGNIKNARRSGKREGGMEASFLLRGSRLQPMPSSPALFLYFRRVLFFEWDDDAREAKEERNNDLIDKLARKEC